MYKDEDILFQLQFSLATFVCLCLHGNLHMFFFLIALLIFCLMCAGNASLMIA